MVGERNATSNGHIGETGGSERRGILPREAPAYQQAILTDPERITAIQRAILRELRLVTLVDFHSE